MINDIIKSVAAKMGNTGGLSPKQVPTPIMPKSPVIPGIAPEVGVGPSPRRRSMGGNRVLGGKSKGFR